MGERLKEKVALITGSGSGIGKAMAVLFAKEGASIVVADVVDDRIEEVVSQIEESGGKAVGIYADIAEETDIEKMIETATNTYGRIDILCNNAGILDKMMPVAEVTDELWHKVMRINLEGPFRACRKTIPLMLEQGGGVILNVSSMAGMFGCRGGTVYTVSKHGLVGLTKNLAYMYADKGIRCNAICPGGVETNVADLDTFNEFGFSRMSLGISTMPRTGKPEEIASFALMLVSDDAGFVNGAVIPVDAGWAAY
jgi:NAD(P)-dependent dehydrogenase (short-subunit alcohol dehydrogenase family)